ncbi:unnamed protein product [Nezara viridula]|uniref:Uncharacterized protein n=1 Tax=Nezara viridula TaxID=85310 RepID=A0A9P0MT62_NEZVI|nr:unnamed protein product [Nezara viridula]
MIFVSARSWNVRADLIHHSISLLKVARRFYQQKSAGCFSAYLKLSLETGF